MRGVYSAQFLNTLATRVAPAELASAPLDPGTAFDLIAGTSTGAILAGALALGVPMSEVISLYRDRGPSIFANPMPAKKWKLLAWCLANASRPANPSEPLRESLQGVFGAATLGTVFKDRGIGLCVPATNLSTHSSWVFKTPHDPTRTRDANYSLVDVCMATTAAPIFLPPALVPDPDDPEGATPFVDGGLWANNPTLVALIDALSLAKADQDVEVFSVGTCPPPVGHVVGSPAAWGLAAWQVGAEVLATSLDAQSAGYSFMAQLIAPHLSKPCRVFTLPCSPLSASQSAEVALDKASPAAIEILTDAARHDANHAYGEFLRGAETPGSRLARALRSAASEAVPIP